MPVSGVTGLGYSGFNNAQWERGANLQQYYSRKEEQDAKAVGSRFVLCIFNIVIQKSDDMLFSSTRPLNQKR